MVVLTYWVIGLHLEAYLYTLFHRTMHLLSTNWIQSTYAKLEGDNSCPRGAQRTPNTHLTNYNATRCAITKGVESLRKVK